MNHWMFTKTDDYRRRQELLQQIRDRSAWGGETVEFPKTEKVEIGAWAIVGVAIVSFIGLLALITFNLN